MKQESGVNDVCLQRSCAVVHETNQCRLGEALWNSRFLPRNTTAIERSIPFQCDASGSHQTGTNEEERGERSLKAEDFSPHQTTLNQEKRNQTAVATEVKPINVIKYCSKCKASW